MSKVNRHGAGRPFQVRRVPYPSREETVSRAKKWPARDMIVKVQIPIGGDDHGQFLVYDEARTIYQEMPMPDELRKMMGGEAKAFFHAHVSAVGFLTIARRARWQDW